MGWGGEGEEKVHQKEVSFSHSRDITTDPESQKYADSLFSHSLDSLCKKA